jgi:hypothetical protein
MGAGGTGSSEVPAGDGYPEDTGAACDVTAGELKDKL